MARTSVRYIVNGEEKVTHELRRFAARAMEPEPILYLIADALRTIEKDRFAKGGPGWAELAASTVERKGHSKIGIETEAMMDSLTKKGAEGSLEEVIGNVLHFGTNLTDEEGFPYPVVFDEGRKDGTQPARPLFDVDEKMLKMFTKSIQAYLLGISGPGGLKMGDYVPGPKSYAFAAF